MLEIVLSSAEKFYKVNSKNIIVALYQNMSCYNLKCYDRSCGCDCTDSCDLQQGETVFSVYPDAIEIGKDEFKNLWINCSEYL